MATFASQWPKPWALTLLVVISLSGVLRAQAPAPETKDPLGRTTPQGAVFQFLEACHARDYSKATHYLDLRHMPAAERAKQGPELASSKTCSTTPRSISPCSAAIRKGILRTAFPAAREHLDT